jgi:amidase
VQLTGETARAQAREADASLVRGEVKGPLHGVPFTVKDTIETVGVVCTAGTKGRESFIPTQDATTVARLRAAGAVLLGKTNVPEFGLNTECDNLVYGKTNNPYLPAFMPGGSSGGEAAILAAGGSSVGLGSQDLGLSAHYCGIASLKPTTKRAPMTGHCPLPTFGVTSHQLVRGGIMWQIGPMARFVEDLRLVLPLIVGEDGLDPNMTTIPLGNPEAVELKRLQAAFYPD